MKTLAQKKISTVAHNVFCWQAPSCRHPVDMPFGFHSQSDGITAAADESGQKNNPKTCHIDLSVSDEEHDKVNFKNIS